MKIPGSAHGLLVLRNTIFNPEYSVFMCDCEFLVGCLSQFSSKLSVANRASELRLYLL